MAEPHRAVLMVDGDLGFLFVLARELDHRGISLIPSGSAKQARLMLASLKLTIDVLIINCQLSGGCALAREMVHHNAKLEVIGIVSGVHQCSSCRQLLTLIAQDPEPREARWIRNLASLVQGRLRPKQKLAIVKDSRSSKPLR
jgi:DNA-binding NtrC family response regulator